MKANASLAGIILALAIAIAFFATEATAASTKSVGYDADGATPGIQNTHPHNLSSGNTDGSGIHATVADDEYRVCVFCHTPHAASTKGALWNRADPAGGFPLYGQSNIEIDTIVAAKYGGGNEYPNGASRLCLSCHDGVTAVGEVLNGGTLANLTMSGSGTVDLSRSHPISFVYTPAIATAIETGQVVPVGSYIVPAAGTGYLDSQDRMQCTACHDPHMDTYEAGTYELPMWRHTGGTEAVDYDNTCAACHLGGAGSSGLDLQDETANGFHNL